jgi:hypothetical protein
MARIDWIKHRLDNWALWKVRESSGGLGFATKSVLLSDFFDCSREAPLPIDEIDAAKTDRAVEALKLGKGHIYVTLHLIYIKGIGIRGTAQQMGRAESTVKANLDQADHLLALYFNAEHERAKTERDRLQFERINATKRSLST